MQHQLSYLLILLILSSCVSPESKGTDAKEQCEPAAETTVLPLQTALNVDSHLTRSGIAGLGMAKVDSAGKLFATGFGIRALDGRPYEQHTVQNIGSISKVFIGLTLLKAQELGHLHLDDDVNTHLPFAVRHPDFPDTPITLRMLATHSSSIRDSDFYEKSYILLPDEPLPSDSIQKEYAFQVRPDSISMLAFMQDYLSPDGKLYSAENFIEQAPGTWFEYSNMGATLAAAVIEAATGRPFASFSAEHILSPLKMRDSSWSFEQIDQSNRSRNFIDAKTVLPRYELITYPDGGMLTSSHDMCLFMQELIAGLRGKGTLLSASGYHEFYSAQLDSTYYAERDADFRYNDEYNMGIFMGLSASEHVGHTGGDPGITSFMFINKETGLGRYLIFNSEMNSQERFDLFVSLWEEME